MTAAAVHTIIILGSTNAGDSAAVRLALTYAGVGLCGELIAMLGLVSTMDVSVCWPWEINGFLLESYKVTDTLDLANYNQHYIHLEPTAPMIPNHDPSQFTPF